MLLWPSVLVPSIITVVTYIGCLWAPLRKEVATIFDMGIFILMGLLATFISQSVWLIYFIAMWLMS